MYKSLNIPVLILFAVIALSSCKKEGGQLELENGKFPTAALNANTQNLILTSAAENDTSLQLIWQAASFGQKPVVSYTIQMDLPTDTAASGNNWGNAKSYTVSNGKYIFGFENKLINNALNELGALPNMVNKIVFRLRADINQSNGAGSSIVPAYSNTVAVNITSYETNLYVPGAYQGWNPGAAPVMSPVSGRPGMYESYVYITGGGTQYFKYTNAPDWNHTNYGDGGNGTFSTDGNAGGLHVDQDGYYELTANLNNMTWTATKTTWGIIGDATPGGWGGDTQLTYDPATQVWTVTANMLHNGSFKFRANNEWAIDFGIDAANNIQYADNPFLGYNGTLNNLTVPEDGNYTITLDLHVSQHYTYTLHKN